MSFNIIQAALDSELQPEFHLGRLLLLLAANDKGQSRPMKGIMKLAKLDFVLRYPNSLERAMRALGKNAGIAEVTMAERKSIESRMIRFRYGPWDTRYRTWISLLTGKGLVTTFGEGKTVNILLTPKGYEVASMLSQETSFRLIDLRAKIITKNFGDMSASALKNFMYDTFPELTMMKWGEEIVI
jgi:hypothetical protein